MKSYLIKSETDQDCAIKMITWLSDYFGVEATAVTSLIVMLSTKNTKLARNKVLKKITGEE